MDKNAIKKYAVWARTELITRVSQRAEKYDITAEADVNASSVNGVLLSDAEKKQRKALIEQVQQKGFDQVMEEVAYTWFNRFIALRFMEVNGYLPSHIRVFTDDNNNFKPQILAEAIHLELDGLDMEKVYEMKNTNENDELYKYLLITQCNALCSMLPAIFQAIDDYAELLIPDHLLLQGSVVEQLVTMISEDDWKDQVQIIGWLYQYYNSEVKTVIDTRAATIKVAKEEIPVVTQFFTPDWIVRYLVQNSLGKICAAAVPSCDVSKWEYFLDTNEEDSITADELKSKYKNFDITAVKVLDPSMGSGHILVYTFDFLMDIYMSLGWTKREAVRSILENNLYGLDIDKRAYQLSYFALLMKAREYDRRVLTDNIRLNLAYFQESNGLNKYNSLNIDDHAKNIMQELYHNFFDAKTIGSILNTTLSRESMDELNAVVGNYNPTDIFDSAAFSEAHYMIQHFEPIIRILTNKYDVIVTNPPYLGIKNYNPKLADYIDKYYNMCKYDLFSCFVYKSMHMLKKDGMAAMLTQQTWLNIDTFQKFRKYLLTETDIVSALHLGKNAIDGGLGTVAFILMNNQLPNFKNCFVDLTNFDSTEEKSQNVKNTNLYYYSRQDSYIDFPKNLISYNASDRLREIFKSKDIIDIHGDSRNGLQTNNNDLFLRCWFEVDLNKIRFNATEPGPDKWYPHVKGGSYRKWYGNYWFIINFENNGKTICDYIDSQPNCRVKSNGRVINREYYFEPGISWSLSTYSAPFSMRVLPSGFIFNIEAPTLYRSDHEKYYLGLLNSHVGLRLLDILSDDVHYKAKDVANVPIIYDADKEKQIVELVDNCIRIAKEDWDSTELSWEFKRNPIVQKRLQDESFTSIQACCLEVKKDMDNRIVEMSRCENELNGIFAEIYGLSEDIQLSIDDNEITLRRYSDVEEVKALISYAVGCMFGRYSIDVDGVVATSNNLEDDKYKTITYDSDNVIPICDDYYFNDDITGRFVEFVEQIFGKEKLEQNLQFIADTIGGKGASREVIRNYFINSFFQDHCNLYSVTGSGKRPIYWLFDSGKKNGFKCLIYVHRYQADTIARIRTDYVHEQQSRYRTAIDETEKRSFSASGSEKVRLDKKLKKLREQEEEIHKYEEKVHHLADQMISIDLDDGVNCNYVKFQDILAKIK